MAAKLPIFVCTISISAKIWKTPFQKEVFNETWLIIGDYKCIDNTEIKNWKYNFCAILGAEQFFADPPC